MYRVGLHLGKDSIEAVTKQSNAQLFKSIQERSVHIELGSQQVHRSNLADAVAADDDDRNYMHINLSE
jgi:hypothetical protein